MISNPPRDTWLRAALLVLLTILVYLPSVHAGFIWDDDALLTGNPAVKTADGLYSIWLTSWSGDYVPLTSSSFWLEWRLWKANPAGYHVLNILLHAANAAVLWRVLARLRIPGAWLAGLLFAVHPVCAASVTWIAERKNTLSMLFYLASLLFFLRDDEEAHPPPDADRALSAGGGRSKWFWYSLGAFLLALLAKSSVAILPPVLLLCVWWRRGRIARRDFARSLPFFALSVLFSVVAIGIQHKALHAGAGPPHDSLPARLIGGSWAVWFYVGKILLPVNLTMIYPRWRINPAAAISYVPSLLLAGMILLFWRNRNAWGRPFLFGIGYFIIALSPVLGIVDMAFFSNSQVADHFQYLAIPGIVALIAAGIARVAAQRRRAFLAAGAGAAIAVAMFVLTWRREAVLGNSEKLWADNAVKNPASWRVFMNLNMALLEQGKTNQAIQMYNKALELFPGNKTK